MPPLIKLTIAERAFPSQRAWRRASQAAHAEAAQFFHTELLPQHFRPGAAAAYGYRRRSPGYRQANPRAAGRPTRIDRAISRGEATPEARSTDLVFTGRFRAAVLAVGTVRAFPTRATLSVRAPAYVPRKPRTSRQPPLADELTRTNARDERRLNRRMEQILQRTLEQE